MRGSISKCHQRKLSMYYQTVKVFSKYQSVKVRPPLRSGPPLRRPRSRPRRSRPRNPLPDEDGEIGASAPVYVARHMLTAP